VNKYQIKWLLRNLEEACVEIKEKRKKKKKKKVALG
jgi:hypothetical protein